MACDSSPGRKDWIKSSNVSLFTILSFANALQNNMQPCVSPDTIYPGRDSRAVLSSKSLICIFDEGSGDLPVYLFA